MTCVCVHTCSLEKASISSFSLFELKLWDSFLSSRVAMNGRQDRDGGYLSVRERCQKGSRSNSTEQSPDNCDVMSLG